MSIELDMSITYKRRCPAMQPNGRMCMQPAGSRTNHKGWGFCRFHQGGFRPVERTWAMAFELADETGMNPLEALLHSVRVAGAHAAWADVQLQAAIKRQEEDGHQPGDEPTSAVDRWMVESRKERTLFTRSAKAAVDAGVSAALVARLDMESTAVAEAVMAAVDAIPDLDPAHRNLALGKAQDRLMEIAGETSGLAGIVPEA